MWNAGLNMLMNFKLFVVVFLLTHSIVEYVLQIQLTIRTYICVCVYKIYMKDDT